ncbi:MAG: glyceraldehyde-3-phosphate dehydrogenase [Saprospiraceae bacterium]
MQADVFSKKQADNTLANWREQEKKALELLNIVGNLRFDRSIELVLFRHDIYDSRPSELLNNHRLATNYIDHPIEIDASLAVARAIADMGDMAPAKIDLGKLTVEWMNKYDDYSTVEDFIDDKLADFEYTDADELSPKDVILYGFGRIGRLAARRLIGQTGRGEQLRLRAIVLRSKMKDRAAEMEKRASLLRSDSMHGDFHGSVVVSDDLQSLIINGNEVQVIFSGSPSEIDYTKYGIKDALVIDNTGVWRDREALSTHLRPGVAQVMLTAPGKGIPNVVYGVNHEELDLSEQVLCAASCTTNAIVPILKVVEDNYGIERGHIETIHSYTSDQNLLDNFHKKPRRGRAAAVNMVLTTTGAAKAVANVMPNLAGKLTGNAVRVPTPNVSLAIISLTLKNKTSVAELNSHLQDAAFEGDLVEQIHYSNSTEFSSTNALGMTTTSVLDAPSTIVAEDGKNVTLYAWYDNEYGYTCQVVRLAKHVAKVRRRVYF